MKNFLQIVQRRSSDIYVAVVYRHPDCNMKVFNLEFFNFSNYFSNRLSFILGDFNVDLLTASSLQSSSQFYNNVASCSLLPVFTKPTRITSNSQSIIDNIFTNFPLRNCLLKILVVDISDHFPIFLQIPIKFDHSNSKTKQTRLYDINCKNKFHNLLSSCDWSSMLNDYVNDDPCSAYTNFISIYSRLYNESFPLMSHYGSFRNLKQPWMSPSLLKSCQIKYKLYRIFLKHPTDLNKQAYISVRNTFKKTKIATKKFYYDTLFLKHKSNMHKTWDVIKSLIGYQSNAKNNSFSLFNDKDELLQWILPINSIIISPTFEKI